MTNAGLKASQMLANTPGRGSGSKIVFAKPGMEDEEEDRKRDFRRAASGTQEGPGVQAPMGFGGQGMGNSMGGGGGGMGGMGGGGMNGMGFKRPSPDPEDEEEDDEEDLRRTTSTTTAKAELREGESAEVKLDCRRARPAPRSPHQDHRGPSLDHRRHAQFVVRGQSPNDAGSSFGQQLLGRHLRGRSDGIRRLRPGRASRGRSS